MFKVQDNPDGSTSVFCKNSGNLLCNIPGKQNSNIPRRINVVKPQPIAGSSRTSWCIPKDEFSPSDDVAVKFETKPSLCRLSPIPIGPDGDQSEDYSDDCLTQDAFAKCLDLVSAERLRAEPRDRLLAEYPLRLLSRSRAYRTLEEHPDEDLRDLKLPDDMPLTSCLGTKILALNADKNFAAPHKVSLSIKGYDSYCRHPFRANSATSVHFPKLRCREKKQYPIAASGKASKSEMNHFYTFGRKQLKDRVETVRTGLNARARKLLSLCKTKKWKVKVKRLSAAEIEALAKMKWSALLRSVRSSGRHAPALPSVASRAEPPRSGGGRTRGPPLAPADHDWKPSRGMRTDVARVRAARTRRRQEGGNSGRTCAVRLRDVTRDIRRAGGRYVVGNTSVSVPFYDRFLSTRLASSSPRGRKKSLLAEIPVRSRGVRIEYLRENIPVVDLTQENEGGASSKFIVSQWKVHCFGCHFERLYVSRKLQSQDVEKEIREHMVSYHLVSNPEAFLLRYLDQVNRCTVIEAFPGYKNSPK